jgi:hypothetical protein
MLVIVPLVFCLEVKDGIVDRWKNPWRVELYSAEKRWVYHDGRPTLEEAMKRAVSLRQQYKKDQWRVRHWRMRTYLMADIL